MHIPVCTILNVIPSEGKKKIVENEIGSFREGGRHSLTLDGYCSRNFKSKFDKDATNKPNQSL